MTLPSSIRIFFALDLPSDMKEKLGDFINVLRKKSKFKMIRWTKPENLHITLQFLPEVHSEHLEQLMQNVQAKIIGMDKKLILNWGSLHLLPSPYRPRVIVLSMDSQEDLANLAELIGQGIQLSNYDIDKRPFHAHLTLGRIKHMQNTPLQFLEECSIPPLDELVIKEIVLFRSIPDTEGSKYIPLERISLMRSKSF